MVNLLHTKYLASRPKSLANSEKKIIMKKIQEKTEDSSESVHTSYLNKTSRKLSQETKSSEETIIKKVYLCIFRRVKSLV